MTERRNTGIAPDRFAASTDCLSLSEYQAPCLAGTSVVDRINAWNHLSRAVSDTQTQPVSPDSDNGKSRTFAGFRPQQRRHDPAYASRGIGGNRARLRNSERRHPLSRAVHLKGHGQWKLQNLDGPSSGPTTVSSCSWNDREGRVSHLIAVDGTSKRSRQADSTEHVSALTPSLPKFRPVPEKRISTPGARSQARGDSFGSKHRYEDVRRNSNLAREYRPDEGGSEETQQQSHSIYPSSRQGNNQSSAQSYFDLQNESEASMSEETRYLSSEPILYHHDTPDALMGEADEDALRTSTVDHRRQEEDAYVVMATTDSPSHGPKEHYHRGAQRFDNESKGKLPVKSPKMARHELAGDHPVAYDSAGPVNGGPREGGKNTTYHPYDGSSEPRRRRQCGDGQVSDFRLQGYQQDASRQRDSVRKSQDLGKRLSHNCGRISQDPKKRPSQLSSRNSQETSSNQPQTFKVTRIRTKVVQDHIPYRVHRCDSRHIHTSCTCLGQFESKHDLNNGVPCIKSDADGGTAGEVKMIDSAGLNDTTTSLSSEDTTLSSSSGSSEAAFPERHVNGDCSLQSKDGIASLVRESRSARNQRKYQSSAKVYLNDRKQDIKRSSTSQQQEPQQFFLSEINRESQSQLAAERPLSHSGSSSMQRCRHQCDKGCVPISSEEKFSQEAVTGESIKSSTTCWGRPKPMPAPSSPPSKSDRLKKPFTPILSDVESSRASPKPVTEKDFKPPQPGLKLREAGCSNPQKKTGPKRSNDNKTSKETLAGGVHSRNIIGKLLHKEKKKIDYKMQPSVQTEEEESSGNSPQEDHYHHVTYLVPQTEPFPTFDSAHSCMTESDAAIKPNGKEAKKGRSNFFLASLDDLRNAKKDQKCVPLAETPLGGLRFTSSVYDLQNAKKSHEIAAEVNKDENLTGFDSVPVMIGEGSGQLQVICVDGGVVVNGLDGIAQHSNVVIIMPPGNYPNDGSEDTREKRKDKKKK
jgi:hypothetical protein